MAEIADTVFGLLLDNLTQILQYEFDLISGVHSAVDSLRNELNLAHLYLKSFEGKRNEQDIATEYANQVRGLVHEAEDIIDTYVASLVQQRGDNLIQKAKLKFVELRTKRDVAERIIEIRGKLNEVYSNRERFGIQAAPARVASSIEDEFLLSGKWSSPPDEMDVVGFDLEAENLTHRLLDRNPERDVIPLVGMSGIGKTTLAAKVYNGPDVVGHFNFRAWVCVSQVYSVREFLETIIKSVVELTEEIKNMRDDKLRMDLYRRLRGSRYLIVLDDVWKTRSWKELERFFPNNLFGSKIILTTQLKEVGLSVNPSPHYLQPMNKEKSWELLSKKVFLGGNCPSELEELGIQIACKCRGLPLAIVVIAGVLVRKEKTTKLWSKVSSSVSATFDEERAKEYSEFFELSYNNLPHHLRLCFLYFGLFPEDAEISTRQLASMWVAEGFIPKKEHRSLEEVAEEYLEDLVSRNLIQLAQKKYDGGIKATRIHDLLRLFCISKASEGKILEVRGSDNYSTPCASRRLGIHSNTLQYISSNKSALSLRSLLCFGQAGERITSIHWKYFYKGYMLLRVLDLYGVIVHEIPSEIEKLICLRYLRLKSDSALSLPPSICNLWNLQSFELVAPRIDRPVVNVWSMRQLRHFYFKGEAVLKKPPKTMLRYQGDSLSNLETLSCISPESCTETIFSELPNLAKLGIRGDLEKHKDIALMNVPKIPRLRKLKLVRDRQHPCLTRLPLWNKFSSTLVKLTLMRTELSMDPMKQLGNQFPCLEVLKLIDGAYAGRTLDCRNSRFPRLAVLKLVNLGIVVWDVSVKSFPNLRTLLISRCGCLEGLPPAIQEMSNFREMHLWWPNPTVAQCAKDIKTYKGKEQFKLLIFNALDKDSAE